MKEMSFARMLRTWKRDYEQNVSQEITRRSKGFVAKSEARRLKDLKAARRREKEEAKALRWLESRERKHRLRMRRRVTEYEQTQEGTRIAQAV